MEKQISLSFLPHLNMVRFQRKITMKQNRTFPWARVTKKQEATLKKGHPWVYEDEITEQSESIENGSLIDVFSEKGSYLGTGFYSACSRIRIRILDHNANETFNDAFFERRVRYAVQYRYDVMPEDVSSCRLIHGEADGLCGLTVDKYEDLLVSEVLSYGMEQKKGIIYRALTEVLAEKGVAVRGIFERNEEALRRKEGLELYKGWADIGKPIPDSPVVIITENGIQYEVDVENGQKTGFFLDQKYNRRAIWPIANGRTVLDCCTHTGSFALNAAKAGAVHVTAADISEFALKQAEQNAVRNQLDGVMDFVCADVFDLLEELRTKPHTYDFIILDPPAFTKSRKTFASARAGYRRLNASAMRLLKRGDYLATASCSHFMPNQEFRNMLKDAAMDAGVSIRIIEERHAAKDHPVLISVPETEYLKLYLLQIV